MTEYSASAPGKIILFGEHAVVHGQPAIAAPLPAVTATATVRPGKAGMGVLIIAANLSRTIVVYPRSGQSDHALAVATRLLIEHFRLPVPDLDVVLNSTIPVASGLGSGAAATTALLRALAAALHCELDSDTLNGMVYEIEKLHHGTPSGIDNTVVVYERPIYFVRGRPIETFTIGAPLEMIVADTGISSPTHTTVADVLQLYEFDPDEIGQVFEQIGEIVRQARLAIEQGDHKALGTLMRENHKLLIRLTVSSPVLDQLVDAAVSAGALGAKLSGGGRGGNLIALVTARTASAVEAALLEAGARSTIRTTLS